MDLRQAREAVGDFTFKIGSLTGNGKYKLIFTGPEYDKLVGATVQAQKAYLDAESPEDNATAYLEYMKARYAQFVARVTIWNLADGGVPIPLTVEGLTEFGVQREIIDAVYKGINEAENPKA